MLRTKNRAKEGQAMEHCLNETPTRIVCLHLPNFDPLSPRDL